MGKITRRRLMQWVGASTATLSCSPIHAPRAFGQSKPRLVVIGGGPAGGTVARSVMRESQGAIDVTLIEPQQAFTTCFFSNLYVGGLRDLASLTHGFDNLRKDGV